MTSAPTVAEFIRRSPGAAEALHRHGVGFAQRALALTEACAQAGVAVDAVEREATACEADPGILETASLEALLDHVMECFHVPLRRELPRLRAQSAALSARHAGERPELAEVARLVGDFADATEEHLAKEEQALFPWIRASYDGVEKPISFLRLEHVESLRDLELLRRSTGGFQAAPDAPWHELYASLAAIEAATAEHVRLEDEVIFRRALAR